MRPAVLVSVLLVAGTLLAGPAAAQSQPDRWMLHAQFGPAFGTLGTTPAFDAKAGYTFNQKISLVGEFGGLPHAAFDKAAPVAPTVNAPAAFADSNIHVNGYYYNANLIVTPKAWARVTPYLTGGFGAFTGSTVAQFDRGATTQMRYKSATNPASNVGGGISYRLNRWLGVNGDYRHFIVNADAVEHVNRFSTGVSLFVK
jgi:opacity protein-like surface antigen